MSLDHNAPPFNPIPPVVWALILPIIAVEVVLSLGGMGLAGGPEAAGWRLAALERYGFYQPMFEWMLQTGQFRWDYAIRFLTYPFIHGGLTHMVFVVVFLLALGKMVSEIFSAWAVVLIFFASSIVGALVYGLVFETRAMLFGGYPAAYGFVGAYTFILWAGLGPRQVTKFQAFTLIGFLMAIQLIFGAFFGAGYSWLAELAGAVTGFVLSFAVSPGGWSAILQKLRRRG